MEKLMAKNFQEFLKDNGYKWSGFIAENFGGRYEDYYKCDKYRNYLDDTYILLGSQYDWDENTGKVDVVDNGTVKYIRHDDITFKVYKTVKGRKYELEHDLSNEWVRYQTLNIQGYAESTLGWGKHIQEHYPDIIQYRKNLLAQEIERITCETVDSIKSMEESIARSKEVEQIIKHTGQERLIKKQIELGAKDNFKDTKENDACLQHLADAFGKQ